MPLAPFESTPLGPQFCQSHTNSWTLFPISAQARITDSKEFLGHETETVSPSRPSQRANKDTPVVGKQDFETPSPTRETQACMCISMPNTIFVHTSRRPHRSGPHRATGPILTLWTLRRRVRVRVAPPSGKGRRGPTFSLIANRTSSLDAGCAERGKELAFSTGWQPERRGWVVLSQR